MRANVVRRREPLAARRQAAAFRLRAAYGLSFDEIAAQLGVSRSAAWKAYQRELTRVRHFNDPNEIREHVQMALHRLDWLLALALSIVSDEGESSETRLRAVDRAIRVEERRARLLGLDAPDRAEGGIRTSEPSMPLSDEEMERELEAFAMPAATAIHRGPDAVVPPVQI